MVSWRESGAFVRGKHRIRIFHHIISGLRVVFCEIPGPLCSAAICFGTEADNNEGLPHTLEHLVFMGSRTIPYKGFLDTMANRCLASGTNAWTAVDHTAYTVRVAGREGFLNILPVYLDHVLHPTLTDDAFVTEVYHVDGEGQEQGVVYCEMQGSENTEGDLRENAFKSLLYPNTGYCYDTGGLTPDIAKLTNEQIRHYHAQFYRPEKCTLVVAGDLDINQVLDVIENYKPSPLANFPSVPVAHPWSLPIPPLPAPVSTTVMDFPSADESMGSVVLGWRGPPLVDIETCTAIDVLFRYLQETSASPLAQRFVEQPHPLASDVGYSMRSYQTTGIDLVFEGVPVYGHTHTDGPVGHKHNGHCCHDEVDDDESEEGDGEGGTGDEEGDEMEEGSEAEGDGMEEDEDGDDEEGGDGNDNDGKEHSIEEEGGKEEAQDRSMYGEDLLKPGAILGRLLKTLRAIVQTGQSDNGEDRLQKQMLQTLERHRIKFMESMEDDALDVAVELLVPDVIFPDTPLDHIGSSLDKVRIIEELTKRTAAANGSQYWRDLLQRWIIAAPVVEVIMRPSMTLAEKIAEQQKARIAERVSQLGPELLAQCEKRMQRAVENNGRPLPEDILAKLPMPPSPNDIPQLPSSTTMLTEGLLFPVQLVRLDTEFVHVQICFGTAKMEAEVRPYLVLLQSLLLSTSLLLPPTTTDSSPLLVPYTEVVEALSRDTVSVACGIGLGNQTFSCQCLSEMFYVYGCGEVSKYQVMVDWLCKVLFHSVFPPDRIQSVAKNLISSVSEEKRDGASMCDAASTAHLASSLSNDVAMSICRQEPFLRSVLQSLKPNTATATSSSPSDILLKLREWLVADASRTFVQLCVPLKYEGDPLQLLLERWKVFAAAAAATAPNPLSPLPTASPLPNFAINFDLSKLWLVHPSADDGVIVPVKGIDSSYLCQSIACPLSKTSVDYYAVLLLIEILCRSEGPLYKEIRGKGYAYDASVVFSVWHGQLYFSLYESSALDKATEIFYDILRRVPDQSGADPIIHMDHIISARGSLLYKLTAARSTPPLVMKRCFQSWFLGFAKPEEEVAWEARLSVVTEEDLLQAYQTYFVPFLGRPAAASSSSASGRFTSIACSPSRVDAIKSSFASMHAINLRTASAEDLQQYVARNKNGLL